MKTIRLALFLAALLGVSAMAADTQPEAAKSAAKPTLTDTRDAFLAFALDKAKEYTDKAEVAAGKAIDVIAKESPIMVAEFLTWRAWMHGIKAVFPLVLVTAGLLLMNYHWKRYEFGGYYGQKLIKGTELNVIGFAAGVIAGASGVLTFLAVGASHLLDLVQLLVAPRIYLVEQVLHQFGK